ncbi:LTA synthase family protein [Peribacillus sp. SCS-155]|uniref:LTA synthase family protein n=1 Tax=Peribacillus sedimenti TaxID=3115297 RepID=UPI0039064325
MKSLRSLSKTRLAVYAALCSLWLKTVAVSFAGFNLTVHSWMDILVILANPAGSIVLLLGFSFYFSKELNRLALFLILLLGTGLLYADLLYYRFYIDFVTVSVLFQFHNVGGIGPSTFELIKRWDWLMFADLFIFGALFYKWRNIRMVIRPKRKKQYLTAGIAMLAALVAINAVHSANLLKSQFNRHQLVKAVGPYNYHLYDIAMGLRPTIDRVFADKKDTVEIENYVSHKKGKESPYFGAAEGKNLILISMESMQNFVMNRELDGQEITPFLNGLIKESFYFSQIYDQTAQGKTSDAEFMIDAGLYPLSSGSVFVRRPDNTFNSLPKILEAHGNYYSASFHGNDPEFWNRQNMYQSLGYDRFYSKPDYEVTPENSINYGIKDIPFFEQSISHIMDLPQPFYAKFITLTNHFPFLLNEEDQLIPQANTEQEVVNRYVTTVRYQDEAIKKFFSSLKKKGLYENSVFVLYGDHYGISEKYQGALNELLDKDSDPVSEAAYKQVPVIIHIPGQKAREISSPGGEIDIRETILHLFGIKTKGKSQLVSFGHDLFTRDKSLPVIFRDGDFVTDSLLYKDDVCYDRKAGIERQDGACERLQTRVNDELNLSDEIIFRDLLRFLTK